MGAKCLKYASNLKWILFITSCNLHDKFVEIINNILALLHAAYKCDSIFRGCSTLVKRQEFRVFIFSIFGQSLSKNDKKINSPLL